VALDQRTKANARATIKNDIRAGKLPKASIFPCTDCGGPAREYDHHLGYEREHWRDVQPVCSRCNKLRAVARGEVPSLPPVVICRNCGREEPAKRSRRGLCCACMSWLRKYGTPRP
jgi:ssDNA-binding Zn-finger/Zn-ribbon topoisomerase 1